MNRLKFIIKVLILSLIAQSLWAEVVFISLYNRSTEEVLPTLQQTFPTIPMSSYGGQIVINAKSNDINQIQMLIKQLDIPARRLLVSIDDSQDKQFFNDTHGSYYDLSQRDRRHFHRYNRRQQLTANSHATNLRQLLINEGSPALIQTTQSTPIVYQNYDYHGRAIRTTQYVDAIQKLYVNIQVVGQQVYIDIISQNDSLTRTASINQQLINNRVSGQLGAWINLGSFQHNSNNSQQNYHNYRRNHNYMTSQIRLKVELAN